MREQRLILNRQLSQLEAEKGSIEDGIREINRRLAVVDEVEAWNLFIEPDDATEITETNQMDFDSEESLNGSGSQPICYGR